MTRARQSQPIGRAILAAGWAVAWALTLASIERDIVIVPFYVEPAAHADAWPVVSHLPSWTQAAAQPSAALRPGDEVVAIAGDPMRGASVARVVSHAWAAMAPDGTLEVEVLRGGAPLAAAVAIPATIPKWPVLVVSLAFGVFALVALLRFRHLELAVLAFVPMTVQALWLAANFGTTPSELLAAFWLRAVALTALLPTAAFFFRHFPDGHDAAVPWARGWPWLLAVQGLFFVDAELFGRLPAALSDLGPKLLAGAVAALFLTIGTVNYRHATAVGRRRFKWLLVGIYVGNLPPALVAMLSAFRPELGAWFLPSQLAQLAIPLSVGIGFWRDEFSDVDRLWNAVLVYLTAAGATVVLLVLGVPAASEALVGRADLTPETARVLGAALLLALVAPPAMALHRRLDAWVLAERHERERRVAALQRALGEAEKLEEVANRLVEQMPPLLGSQEAVVYAELGEGFGAVAAVPLDTAPAAPQATSPLVRAVSLADAPLFAEELTPPPEGWSAPDHALLSGPGAVFVPVRIAGSPGGRLAAFVVIGPRSDGARPDPALRPLLGTLAAHAGAKLTALEQGARLREARSLNEALASQRDKTERLSREKTSLLAAASHDLRQPLHALGLFLGALEERVQDEEARALLDRAHESARSMRQMFEALLDVSQLDAGAIQPQVDAGVSLAPLLADLERDLSPIARGRGLDLRVRPSARLVRTDPVLLRSILQNLVSNALRYTEDGGVLVGARARGGRVRIEVWDTGPGIAAAERERLFDEWRRGVASEDGTGTGLGLAIVQRLCGVLGHDLDLASRPGRGSVFSITLDLGARPPGETAAPSPASRRFEGRCIWVVDDDGPVREGLANLLRTWGAEVAAFATLRSALDAAAEGPPDAWFVDLQLADGSGAELLEAFPGIPACLVSGASEEALGAARERGHSVLRKPVEPVQVRAVLEHLLAS